MRSRPTFALRPLSVAVTALFRGSSLQNTGRFAPSTAAQRCFGTQACSLQRSAPDADVLGQGSTRARRWVIPWGNNSERGKGKGKQKHGEKDEEDTRLTRTLKVLPDAADDVEESDCFRVMSFNMLAQPMASSKMFPYVPKNQLKRTNRWPRVRAEVGRYGADVICLQECDSFDAILASLQDDASKGSRFEGVYKRRNNSEMSHGVAILYDSKRFRLVDSGSCEYGRQLFGGVGAFALLEDRLRRPDAGSGGETGDIGGKRDGRPAGASHDTGYAVSTAGRGGGGGEGEGLGEGVGAETSGIVCVATSHLYWHPDGGAIRLAQAEVLMASMKAFLQERFGDSHSSIPVVLAGDLNNVPGVDVYRLLESGACEGGTPEAFYRRKQERAQARKAMQAEKTREAMAVVAGIRARNAAAISAARDREGSAEAAAAGVGEEAAAAAVDGDAAEAAATSLDGGEEMSGRAAGAASSDTTWASSTAPEGAVGDASAAIEAVDGNQGGGFEAATSSTKANQSSGSESGENGKRDDAAENSPASSKPDGNRDEDVRRYRQGFRGLSSAYGAYSRVFSSQLSSRRPSGESSVCETTGKHTIGHVHLGARHPQVVVVGGGGGGEDLGEGVAGTAARSRRPEEHLEQEEENRSMGEPQLTTCTDNFAGTIDYIWHTPQLKVRALLDLPSLKQAMQGGGLPTASYPSDHFSIMAEMHWRRADEGDATPSQ